MSKPLLKMENFKVMFDTDRGHVTAVNGINLEISQGEIIGIVGESGCGKSVMSQSILRLLEHTDPVFYDGKIIFNDKDILNLSFSELRNIRGNDISVIFQDPLTSLNPVYTIGNQLEEILILHKKMSKKEAKLKAIDLLTLTGINDAKQRIKQYPHELSGGMQQRVMIAMSLATEPKLLIADEPTTALDVTIQAQILDLIVELNKRIGTAILFITHDLGVVSEICHGVKVMYLGEIVEETKTNLLFNSPLHPYTQGLIKSIPKLYDEKEEVLTTIDGVVPSLHNIPSGCGFSTRCQYSNKKCMEEAPPMLEENENHKVKCWRYKEIQSSLKEGKIID